MNSDAPCVAVTEGKDTSGPPHWLCGAGLGTVPSAPSHPCSALAFIPTFAVFPIFFLFSYFCCYNFIKLLSGNNCSFNYSLLVINYLKINIMILFPFLLFFPLLIPLALFINLGVFPWHPNGSCCPAIIISVPLVIGSSFHQPLSSVRAAGSRCPGQGGKHPPNPPFLILGHRLGVRSPLLIHCHLAPRTPTAGIRMGP